jgi:hypothetical protein
VAARQNRSILRHEGAHQLFHTYGVHSDHGAERLWLIEGLASYFETGESEPSYRREELQGNKPGARKMPFSQLVNWSQGFAALGADTEVGLAYAKSWLLVDYMMRVHRAGFFDYIRFVRDPANEAELRETEPFHVLSRFAGRTSEQLEQDLQSELASL